MPTNTHKFKQICQPARLAAQQPAQVASFSEDLSEVLRNLRHTCGHTAKDSTPSIARRREAWKEEALDDLPWKDERGPSSIRRTLEPFQGRRWGNFWEKCIRTFFERIEMNWTELSHLVLLELEIYALCKMVIIKVVIELMLPNSGHKVAWYKSIFMSEETTVRHYDQYYTLYTIHFFRHFQSLRSSAAQGFIEKN